MEINWNKVGAIGSVGSFLIGVVLFFAQVWPYPQWKAEQLPPASTAVASPTGLHATVDWPPKTYEIPKSIVFFLCASFLLASLSLVGAWRKPSAKPNDMTELLRKELVAQQAVGRAQIEAMRELVERERLRIFSPLDHGEVGIWRTVKGSVRPPSGDIQVLVYSGDNYWYLQGPVEVDGSSWSCACKFGLDKPGTGGDYKIVALLGKPVTKNRIPELPANAIKSNEVRVRRTNDADGRVAVVNADAEELIALKKAIYRSYNLLSQQAKALLGFIRVRRIVSPEELKEYFQKYELPDLDKTVSDLRVNSVPYLSPVSDNIKLNSVLENIIAEIVRADEWEFLEATRQTSSDGLEFRIKGEPGFKGRYKALKAQTTRLP